MCLNLWRQLEFELPNYNWAIKVFDTIQNLFCNPLRSLAARVFGTEKRRRRRGTRIFWTDERIFSFLFWAFLVVPFSLSPLETKQHKQEHKTTQQKRKSTFFNRASSFWTLPPVVLFNLSDAFAFVRLFASDSRRKKRAFFFCLFQRRRKGREKRGTRNAKKSSSLSFSFFDRKGKNLLCKSPKKTRRRRRRKKT